MAIALNNSLGFITSTSISFTVGSGSNRLLVVGISSSNVNAATNVQWNGTPLTKATTATSNYGCSIWYLIAPVSGSFNVTFTAPSGATIYDGFVVDLTGADQTASVVNVATKSDSSPASSDTLNVTTTADNCFIVDVIHINNGATLTIGGSQTTLLNNAGDAVGCSYYTTVGIAGVYGMAWTYGSSQFGSHVAVAFAGQAAGNGNMLDFCQ